MDVGCSMTVSPASRVRSSKMLPICKEEHCRVHVRSPFNLLHEPKEMKHPLVQPQHKVQFNRTFQASCRVKFGLSSGAVQGSAAPAASLILCAGASCSTTRPRCDAWYPSSIDPRTSSSSLRKSDQGGVRLPPTSAQVVFSFRNGLPGAKPVSRCVPVFVVHVLHVPQCIPADVVISHAWAARRVRIRTQEPDGVRRYQVSPEQPFSRSDADVVVSDNAIFQS